MTDLRKKINIFRDLKEISSLGPLSRIGFEYSKSCDYSRLGVTNENCMGDYNTTTETMTKRANYTKCVPGKNEINCGPNTFLTQENTECEFVTNKQPSFQIGSYNYNWKELCKSVIEVVTKIKTDKKEEWDNNQKEWTKNSDYLDAVDTPETTQVEQLTSKPKKVLTSKPKVFISGHQHSLQQLFFDLDNNLVECYSKTNPILLKKKRETKEQNNIKNGGGNLFRKTFGFRNSTCIKITEDDIEIVSSNEEPTEKKKYLFLEKGSIQGFLKENYLKITEVQNLLEKINGLYIIRHGQALHNYRDLYKKEDKDLENLKSYLTGNNDVFFNSCLTSQGVNQARKLYTDLDSSGFKYQDGDILISSPMDRAIQTLVEGVTSQSEFFILKGKFKTMYDTRFPEAKKYEENPGEQANFIAAAGSKHRRSLLGRQGLKSKSKKPNHHPKSSQKKNNSKLRRKKKITHQRKKSQKETKTNI